MVVFEFSVALVSFVTGCVFLWLNRVIKQREYLAFSLLCFSAALYTSTLAGQVSQQDNLLFVYRIQRLAICGAILMVLFVVRFVNVLSGRGNKRFLHAFYLFCICLSLMSLFDIYFFDTIWNHYSFIIGYLEIVIRAPGIGYKLFGLAVLIGSVYSISVLHLVWRREMKFVFPSLLGVNILAIFGVYDILWIQYIILKPLHPMTEFGVLAMVGGMAFTLVKRFINTNDQVQNVSNKLKTIEYQNDHLRSIIMQRLCNLYLQSAKSASQLPQDEFIEQFKIICNKNLRNPKFGPDQFAAALHITRVQLNRKIKTLTNKTTSEFIRTMRLEYTAQLLKRNSATITEIAGEAGFENLSYFNRRFKKHFGVTPSAFRQQAHAKGD